MFVLFGSNLKYHLSLLEQLKNENSSLKAQVEFLKESIELERQERIKLQDSILKRTGYLNEPTKQNKPAEFQTIGRAATPWNKLRAKLESDARKSLAPKQIFSKEDTAQTLKEVNELLDKEEKDAS